MILRILLVCCVFLNSCDKFTNENQKAVEMKTYTKEEKLKMFDIMLSQLVKDLKKKKRFSPFKEISDEYSTFSGDDKSDGDGFGGNFQKDDLSVLEQNMTVEEVIRLIKSDHKGRISSDGGGVSFGLVADNFEYGLDFRFPKEQGRWVVFHLSRFRPEYPPDYDAKAHCEKWNDCVESKSPKN
ncbi:hypothetical protein [Leptospira santarosai]|uniref:Lipoprotein n=1 Tax=Leptospira santarosai TaxID=28183 RepID=A0AB73MDB7_9LEPT|nr:hypothetical protein [Leptospira santarosai]ASV10464.1 hypothetical protein B2G51_00050 [Leptospira santarosai]AVV51403.1 Uncharacterized protein XB17_02826 [Leptospira santarosai]EMO71767.1 hypothetical protein LEP1GSC130_0179 [Leptospira santarosai str. 200403458]EMO99794.1 hypothetical protein LEP1GSC120_0001 [Leptospira santarosai str. 200702252]MDI7219636.1 hypothetical protein [Leptospira santarosai]